MPKDFKQISAELNLPDLNEPTVLALYQIRDLLQKYFYEFLTDPLKIEIVHNSYNIINSITEQFDEKVEFDVRFNENKFEIVFEYGVIPISFD